MSNDKRCASTRGVRDGALDFIFRSGIDRGGGVIQNEDMRFGHEGARQSNALTLPTRERDAAFTHDGLITFVKGLDEIISLRRFCSRFHLSFIGCWFAESDIVADRA